MRNQTEHEILWLKRKLETIPHTRLRYRQDIQRQIRERELQLAFNEKR
jgi:hypothetical protein